MPTRSSLKTLGVLAAVVLAACGGDSTQPQATPALAVQSGSGQSATTGQALANPLVVRVSQSGANVTWAVTAGGGSVTPTSSVTGADGLASTVWTLGPNAGANSVQASVSGATGSPAAFAATGTGPPPLQANVAVADNVFNPGSSTIAAGGQVTWTWGGSNDHNVTFPTGTNSATQAAGTFSRTFPAAGTFNYQCTIHGAAMSGTVVVQ